MRHLLIVFILFSGSAYGNCPESGNIDELIRTGMPAAELSKFLNDISSVTSDARILQIRLVKNNMVKVYADGPGHVRKGKGYIYCFVLEDNKWVLSNKEYWIS